MSLRPQDAVQPTIARDSGQRERLSIVIVGHVDHGKSTIIGRILADTGSLPDGKLERVRANCERTSKPFEYAFLLDALKDEQAQGITIDVARVFFGTSKRDYIIVDAPGHIEFLKNMVTGAARAEAALLVIDAREGVQENSRRHGYLLAMLGIGQVAVVINKMDLVDYDQKVYQRTVEEYGAFLKQIEVVPSAFLPVSGREGENLVRAPGSMPWYQGPTVLDVLDGFAGGVPQVQRPFRMPVQDVYKFTAKDDDRRIVAGTVTTGRAKVGDELLFLPSGKQTHIKSIESFSSSPKASIQAGEAVGFTLEEQIYLTRGEIATCPGESAPAVTSRIRTNVFWLGKRALEDDREYILKLGTARSPARVETIHRVVNASSLDADAVRTAVERHEVAEVTFKLSRAIAFDLHQDVPETSRFVIVDDYEIRGGGIIIEALPDHQEWVREQVLLRNAKWEASTITQEQRAAKYNQKAALLLVTGAKDADRKSLGKGVEAELFADGKIVYFLGIGSVLYGVDADIDHSLENRQEHLRRMAEVANILLDAGVILVVTAQELTQEELVLIGTSVDPGCIEVVWVGDRRTTDIAIDLQVPDALPVDEAVRLVTRRLQDRGAIFTPW